MKRINKAPGPNALTRFAQENPDGKWDSDFKNHRGGDDYQAIRSQILDDQGGLCAYCEIEIMDLAPHKQRVEHFHVKSDTSDPDNNWALDWDNVMGVCIGGDDSDKDLHPLPENLSCDSHKNHLFNKGKITEACEGNLLNPLQIFASPCLFDLDKATCELKPNAQVCKYYKIKSNEMENTQVLVQNTIDVLNLNCDRLVQDRRKLLHFYNRQIAKARKENDRNCFSKIANRWFQHKWPSFFTTRRLLLGKHAETCLERINYNG